MWSGRIHTADSVALILAVLISVVVLGLYGNGAIAFVALMGILLLARKIFRIAVALSPYRDRTDVAVRNSEQSSTDSTPS